VKHVPPKVLTRLASLFARTESPFVEEARTSALLAVQIMRKHGLLPDELVERLSAMANKKRRRVVSQRDFAKRGGRKGGKARARALSPERRSEIARQAAMARWRGVTNASSEASGVSDSRCLPVKHPKALGAGG
jgi:hypothetical protein